MITITGNTFAHRDALKALGARWNANVRSWELPPAYATPSALARIRTLVGCIVSQERQEAPEPPLASRPERPRREGSTNIHGDDPTWFNYFASKNPNSFFGFSSLETMAQFVRDHSHLQYDRSNNRNCGWNDIGARREWTGTEDMDECFRIVRDGWSEGAELAEAIIEFMSGDHAKRKQFQNSTIGGSVNVPRMLSGNPMHMRKRAKLEGRKVVTLFCDSSAMSYVDPEMMALRAAIVAAITDLLEQKGYSCEIVSTLCLAKSNRYPAYQIATTIKSAGEKLNINDVVFSLGHPSYFRRLGFAVAASDEVLRYVWPGMGMSDDAFDEDNPTRDNEFFIDKVSAPYVLSIEEMFHHIVPNGFPISLGESDDD